MVETLRERSIYNMEVSRVVCRPQIAEREAGTALCTCKPACTSILTFVATGGIRESSYVRGHQARLDKRRTARAEKPLTMFMMCVSTISFVHPGSFALSLATKRRKGRVFGTPMC